MATAAEIATANPMLPVPVRVQSRRRETADTCTLTVTAPAARAEPYSFAPGQFNMLYVFGVGEVPISISGDPARQERLVHTIRAVGPVSRALFDLRGGGTVGLRGPFGSCWPVETARSHDVVIVAGGIGLAPLRPALCQLLADRDAFGRIVLLYGARSPGDVLYRNELQRWGGRGDLEVRVTVDHADTDWLGPVGVVTTLFRYAEFDPARTVGMVCGPEIMMRFTLREFASRGVSDDRLYVSMERNMQCAVGFCGHCQFGPEFVCMDGPVFRYDRIKAFFQVREA
ncbi:MAG: FAD/NAD(P)-binding protein [Planctomycetes bacterium]|nr:FAD/NAD(P)-binding protein [Planctomycetota bacterium]